MKKIIILALGVALMCSCNDFLDTTPDNRTEIDSPEKFQSLVASGYPKCNYAALLFPRTDCISDLGSGLSTAVNADSFFWRDVDGTSSDCPSGLWEKYYYSIATVNYALRAAEDNNMTKEVGPYIAEAKMIRAFSHFLLVNLFARFYDPATAANEPGIPYVTEPETVVVKQYDRGTVASTYAMIERDLTEGLPGLGLNTAYKVPSYHFTRKAANAFATRFYLYYGKWEKVIEHANNVIPVPGKFKAEVTGAVTGVDGTPLKDVTGTPIEQNTVLSRIVDVTDAASVYATDNFQPWTTTYTTASSATIIREYYTKAENGSNLLLSEGPSLTGRNYNEWRYSMNSADAAASVISGNVTGGSWAFRSYISGDLRYVPKYKEYFVRASIEATTGTATVMYPYLRNEEVLLNRAEANAMLGNYTEAVDDLNVFCRQRIKDYNETNHLITKQKLVNFYGARVSETEFYMNKYKAYGADRWDVLKKSIIQCVIEFRRNEYFMEGLRYWDMARYRIPVYHSTANGRENMLYPGDDRWIIQIPETATLSGIALNPRTNLLSPAW